MEVVIKAFKPEMQWVCMAMITLMSLIPTSGASDLLVEEHAVPTTTLCSTIIALVLNWANASNKVNHFSDEKVLKKSDQKVLRKLKCSRKRRKKNNSSCLIGKRRYLIKLSDKSKLPHMKLQMTSKVISIRIFLLSFPGSNWIRVLWISPEMKLETWIRKIWEVLLGT